MMRYPIVYSYREVIVGNGFVATVETINGRCVMEDFGDKDVWVTGVHPSGFSAGSDDQKSASEAFRKEHRVALLDIAHEAHDFDSFNAMVRDFHTQKSEVSEREWVESVLRVRAGEITSDWLEKVGSDTDPTLKVQCISLNDSKGFEECRTAPSPSLNADEYQMELLAA